MKILKKLMELFSRKDSGTVPLLIIRKGTDEENVKEYKSIEDAIADLENDPNVPSDKVKKLKSSFKKLKNKNSIKIKDGELFN
ncbi:MAG: hypothetical protein M1495_20045 [Bacteroidetes bacterium]|nr:hypothetical protein [Bacteroidota bacterium]